MEIKENNYCIFKLLLLEITKALLKDLNFWSLKKQSNYSPKLSAVYWYPSSWCDPTWPFTSRKVKGNNWAMVMDIFRATNIDYNTATPTPTPNYQPLIIVDKKNIFRR